jgi:hypothetical protein
MKFKFFLLIGIFFLSFVLANCDSGQVDINEASLNELMDLNGIGEVYGQRIIDMRPFDSVDDLIDVSGIGPVTLQSLRDQGVCVSDEQSKIEDETKSLDFDDEDDEDDEDRGSSNSYLKKDSAFNGGVIMEINDSPKTVINLESSKSVEQDSVVAYESKNEKIKNYSIYAFCFFLVLVIAYLLFS